MKDDIQFLKELQNELNTQEHDYQAEPRFWVIMDYRKVVVNEDYDNVDDTEYYYNDGDHVGFKSKEGLIDFIEECDIEEDVYIQFANLTSYPDTTFEEIWGFVEDELNDDGYFNSVPVKEESFIVPDTMFITKKDAQEHIRLNKHHYTDKAHTYAMTAWRSPKVKRLLKILEEFDWDSISNT